MTTVTGLPISVEIRLYTHYEEQLKRIDRNVDKELFDKAFGEYEEAILGHTILDIARLKRLHKDRSLMLEDSFFKGKAQSMDLLAYVTIQDILESQLKRKGGHETALK